MNMTENESETLTLEQAAIILGVSAQTVKSWYDRGLLKGSKERVSPPGIVRNARYRYEIDAADTRRLAQEMGRM